MPEQKISLLSFKEQKLLKLKIETVISESLDGDMKQAALDFTDYVKSMKMSPRWTRVYPIITPKQIFEDFSSRQGRVSKPPTSVREKRIEALRFFAHKGSFETRPRK